jgi:hypothetical protein
MRIYSWIKQLAKVCDTESSRYALGGIECKSDGVTAKLTATDGRILATISYPDDSPPHHKIDVIVNGKELAAPPAAAFKQRESMCPNYDGKSLSYGSTTTEPAVIDGRFPKYEDLFSIHHNPEGYTVVRLDPSYLKTLCELAQCIGGETHKGITLFVKDSQSCVFAYAKNCDTVARLAIMPLACDEENWKPQFPARPGTEPTAAEVEQPAPPPEMLDDDAIAEAVTREPEPMVVAGVMPEPEEMTGIPSAIADCGPLALIGS